MAIEYLHITASHLNPQQTENLFSNIAGFVGLEVVSVYSGSFDESMQSFLIVMREFHFPKQVH